MTDSMPYRDDPYRDDVVRKLELPPDPGGQLAGTGTGTGTGTRLRVADLLAAWSDRLAGRPSPAARVSTGAGGGRPRWSRRRKGVVALVGLIVVVVAAALVAGAPSTSSGTADYAVAPSAPGYATADQAAPFPTPDDFAESEAAGAAASEADGRVSALPPSAAGSDTSYAPEPSTGEAARPPGAEPRIVRDGSASVEVKAGGVETATRSLTATVTGLGGYVEASELTGTASTTDESAQFASVTLRVPADSFDELLGGLGDVGTVLSSTTSSRDVTGEYVDLEARIRALETSRSTYLTLLTQAQTVGDTLAVQQNIDSVQLQLEQIEGQRQVLADAADLATLTVQVAEEGAPTTLPEPEPSSGIGAAFEKSWDRFVDGLEDVIAAIGPIVLFLLLILLGYGILRVGLAVYRRRHPSPPAPPSAPSAPPAQPAVAAASAAPVAPASPASPAAPVSSPDPSDPAPPVA